MEQDTLETVFLPAIEDNKFPKLKNLEINGNRFEEDSDPVNALMDHFEDLELDDLEEPDSEEEEEEEEEEEKMEEIETSKIENELIELQIDNLAQELSKASI